MTRFTLPGSDGQPILGNLHAPAGPPRGVFVITHGFKGYKDYGLFPRLAADAAAAGLVALRFNLSHSGMTQRLDTFERPDLFERDTWGRQVFDLRAVLDAVHAGSLDPATRTLPVVLFGHSRGGVTTLLVAAGRDDLAGVVTAASPASACSLDEAQRDRLRRDGFLVSPSSRTGQDLRVGRAWLDEIEQDPPRFDPRRAAAAVRCPLLILHGDADTTVAVDDAHTLHAAAPRATLQVIPGASHTFDAPNPMGDPPANTRAMIDAAVAFALRCV